VAGDVKKWMRDLPPTTIPGSDLPYSRQVVSFDLPLLPQGTAISGAPAPDYCFGKNEKNVDVETFYALEGGSPFQRERTDLVEQGFSHPGGWYKNVPPIVEARSYVGILVPVTVAPTAEIHYVPIDSSLAEVASELRGSPDSLVGVFRDIRLISKELRSATPCGNRVLIKATEADQYLLACFELPVKRSILGDMLVAPGDQFVF
jgi:hypothetical protein